MGVKMAEDEVSRCRCGRMNGGGKDSALEGWSSQRGREDPPFTFTYCFSMVHQQGCMSQSHLQCLPRNSFPCSPAILAPCSNADNDTCMLDYL